MVKRVVDGGRRLLTPRPDGLPNAVVLWWFPVFLLVLLCIAVLLSISGSSIGMWQGIFSPEPSKNVLVGQPRAIRSDEWLVESSWLISQHTQGFPTTNHVFPGGMDATVGNDAPTWDWSTAFRPHLWGPLVLDLGRGLAFRWWMHIVLLLSAVYAFAVSVLPRRPLMAATLAFIAFLQPVVQWWLAPAVTTAVVFAFSAMTAAVWAIRADNWRPRAIAASIAGYTAVTMGMGIYVPYMLACLYPALAYCVGASLRALLTDRMPVRALARRFLPLMAAGVAVVVTMGLWVATRRETVEAILNTAYPGQRKLLVGDGTYAELARWFTAPFDRILKFDNSASLGINQSEASAPLMVSIFLVVPLLWIAVRRLRSYGPDWEILAVVAVQVLVLAILLIPGWDAVAHLIGAGLVPYQRLRLAFVVLLVITVVQLVERLDQVEPASVPLPVAMLGALAALGATALVWRWLDDSGSNAAPSNYALLATAAMVLALLSIPLRAVAAGVTLLLVATAIIGWGVHPLYRGVFDLTRDTEAGRAVLDMEREAPGKTWVGVGTFISMATIFEAGVPGYSGVQTYPSRVMWARIDPARANEFNWNRLAHVRWVGGNGDPEPRQPGPGIDDVVEMTFDSCAPFAQKYVDYVLADGPDLDQPCLKRVDTFRQGHVDQQIYEVVKTG